jgi:hypothetical protein
MVMASILQLLASATMSKLQALVLGPQWPTMSYLLFMPEVLSRSLPPARGHHDQVHDYRRELQIHVSGFDPPRPVKTFGQAGFDHLLLGAIKKAGYEQPTAIQAQALPAVLSGRDVLVRRLAGAEVRQLNR